MTVHATALQMLCTEARSLLVRLARMEPFILRTPMVPAAAIPLPAQVAIERHLARGRQNLRTMVTAFIGWLEGSGGELIAPAEAQRRFAFLRLRFNAILAQLDIFADVMNQRSEHDTGTWLSGLDVFAADALRLPGDYYQPPPVICYLDRGAGAAIRRTHARLPGGDDNPVAVIRVPRERMIGSGIASSLVHEVGHQGAALLDLVDSLRPMLKRMQQTAGDAKAAWHCWERWISEIVADLWAVARLGIAAPMGLMAVVSLPRPFVFRINLDDPHPAPWIRVKLACAMGQVLYPHPQWERFARVWEAYYPVKGLSAEQRLFLAQMQQSIPCFVQALLNHRPQALRGETLGGALASADRNCASLRSRFHYWHRAPAAMRSAPPALVFAAIGQAKADGVIGAEEESRTLAKLLRYWAFRITLDTSAICAMLPRSATAALRTY